MTPKREPLQRAPDPDTYGETLEWLDGTGSEQNPYVLQMPRDLQAITYDPSAHFVLGCDIDAGPTTKWNDGRGFMPIGSGPQSRRPFTGTLDGQGHEITGLHIARDRFDIGLFGIVEGGTIRDLSMRDCSITALDPDVRFEWLRSMVGIGHDSNRRTGAIAGSFSGRLESVAVNGTISGVDAVGGHVGSLRGGTARDVSTLVEVTGNRDVGGVAGVNEGSIVGADTYAEVDGTHQVGGLAGRSAHGGTIRESTVSGDVGGDENVGGLVGWNHAGQVEASASDATVGGVTAAGGLVGRNRIGDIADCSASGSVFGMAVLFRNRHSELGLTGSTQTSIDASGSELGGLVGKNDDGGTITCCWTDSTVRGPDTVGGAVGANDGSLSELVATGSVIGQEVVGGLVGANRGGLTSSGAAQTATDVPDRPPAETDHTHTGRESRDIDPQPTTDSDQQSDAPQRDQPPASGSCASDHVPGSAVDGLTAVGGLVGENGGSIEECFTTGLVFAQSLAGGVTGHNRGTVRSVHTTGPIAAYETADFAAARNEGTIESLESEMTIHYRKKEASEAE